MASGDFEVAVDAVAENPEDQLSPVEADIEKQVSPSSQALAHMASSFPKCLEFDCSKEKVHLDATIDDMLMRLEEFSSLVDIVKTDSAMCMDQTLPYIFAKQEEMENIFQQVDTLEVFLARVKENLKQLETEVEKAENESSSVHSVKRILSTTLPSLFSMIPVVSSPAATAPPGQSQPYIPPAVFSTEAFFPSDELSNESSDFQLQPSQSSLASMMPISDLENSERLGDNDPNSTTITELAPKADLDCDAKFPQNREG